MNRRPVLVAVLLLLQAACSPSARTLPTWERDPDILRTLNAAAPYILHIEPASRDVTYGISVDGLRRFSLVWPSGYRLGASGERLAVLDAAGDYVALDGQQLTFTGRVEDDGNRILICR